MCSGSEAGSYSRLIDFVYHSNLGLRVITRRRRRPPASAGNRKKDRRLMAMNLITHITKLTSIRRIVGCCPDRLCACCLSGFQGETEHSCNRKRFVIHCLYRGTSLISNRNPVGPYSRIDSVLVSSTDGFIHLWEGYCESRRCPRDTYPDSQSDELTNTESITHKKPECNHMVC